MLSQQGSMPVKKWLASNHMVQSKVGLVAIPHFNNTFGLYYDQEGDLKYKGIIKKEKANSISLSSVPIGAKPLTHLHFNQDGYTKYCKDYKNYWDWVENCNENRYQNNIKHDKNYDSKNMMHTFRLLRMAKEIATENTIHVKRPDREFLLDIKQGKYEYDELVSWATELKTDLEKLFADSNLPERPNLEKINELLIDIRTEFYAKKDAIS